MKLGDVVTINSTTVKKNYPFETICYFDISSVGEGFIREIEEIDLETAPSRARRIIKNGDTIISTVRPENRTFYFCKNVRDNSIASTGFAVLTPFKNLIDERYLYYLITQREFTSYLVNHQKGSTYPAITVDVIENKNIDLPNLDVQKKIARILSAYDDLIENNFKRINLLEQAAQNIYKEWFVNMRFPGHESVEFDSETGLPVVFSQKLLTDLTYEITDGTHDSPKPVEKGFYLVTGKSITNGIIDFSKAYKISQEDHEKIKRRSYLNIGDILYSNIGTIGSTTIVDQDFEFSCKNVIILRPKENHSTFLYCYLTNESTKRQFLQGIAGSNQKFISLKYARNYKGILPSEKLILSFHSVVSNLFEQKTTLNKLNEKLKEAREILLPRLMNQTIKV